MNTMDSIIESIKSQKGRIFNSVIALASISIAHYAGFIMKLPLQIVAAEGGTMAPGVTATFLFYVTLCAVIARVAVGLLQLFIVPFFLFSDRMEHGYKLKGMGKKRKYVSSYNKMLHNEGYIWFALQLFIFVVFLLGLYVNFTFTWKSGVFLLVVLVLIGLSGAFRTKLLLVFNLKNFNNRIKYRESFRLCAVSAVLVTVASALVISSLFVGAMRMSFLKNASPQQVSNQYFTGYAKFLASSGSSTLLFEETEGNGRYIYTTSDYAIAIESKQKAFPMLFRN